MSSRFSIFYVFFLKLFLNEPAMVLWYWLIQIVAQVYDDYLTLNLPTSLNQCLTNITIWYPLVGCLIPLLMLIITTMHSPNIQNWTRPRCASKENGPLTLSIGSHAHHWSWSFSRPMPFLPLEVSIAYCIWLHPRGIMLNFLTMLSTGVEVHLDLCMNFEQF